MWLSDSFAEELKRLGFQRPYFYIPGPWPTHVYFYNEEAWCLGGRVQPVEDKVDFLVKKDIYEKGVWCPTIDDLLDWLDYYRFYYRIDHFEPGLCKVKIYRDDRKYLFSVEAGTVEVTLYYAIKKILEERLHLEEEQKKADDNEMVE